MVSGGDVALFSGGFVALSPSDAVSLGEEAVVAGLLPPVSLTLTELFASGVLLEVVFVSLLAVFDEVVEVVASGFGLVLTFHAPPSSRPAMASVGGM